MAVAVVRQGPKWAVWRASHSTAQPGVGQSWRVVVVAGIGYLLSAVAVDPMGETLPGIPPNCASGISMALIVAGCGAIWGDCVRLPHAETERQGP